MKNILYTFIILLSASASLSPVERQSFPAFEEVPRAAEQSITAQKPIGPGGKVIDVGVTRPTSRRLASAGTIMWGYHKKPYHGIGY